MIPEGMLWNEAELKPDDPLNAGLLNLLLIKDVSAAPVRAGKD